MPYQTAVENKSINKFHSHLFGGGFSLRVHEWFTFYIQYNNKKPTDEMRYVPLKQRRLILISYLVTVLYLHQ